MKRWAPFVFAVVVIGLMGTAGADEGAEDEIPAAAGAETEPEILQPDPDSDPEPRKRSGGFWAMDWEDHRDWTFELQGGAMYLDLNGKIGWETSATGARSSSSRCRPTTRSSISATA